MKKNLNWYLNETLHKCTDVQLLLADYVVLVILVFRQGNNLSCVYKDERFERESILIDVHTFLMTESWQYSKHLHMRIHDLGGQADQVLI